MPLRDSRRLSVFATPVEPPLALRFPTNVSGGDQSAPACWLEFASPHLNGLPILGPGGAGHTRFARVKFRAQTGYRVVDWLCRADGSIDPPDGDGNFYVGGHPYPQNGANTGTSWYHEVASHGADQINTLAGGPVAVDLDRWYSQALVVTDNGSGGMFALLYFDLESISNATKILLEVPDAGYVGTTPSNFKLIIGDSPWFASYQHERLGGSLGPYLRVDRAMSEAEVGAQGANLFALTPASLANLWFYKRTWRSVNDMTCDGGSGRVLTKVDSASQFQVEAIT